MIKKLQNVYLTYFSIDVQNKISQVRRASDIIERKLVTSSPSEPNRQRQKLGLSTSRDRVRIRFSAFRRQLVLHQFVSVDLPTSSATSDEIGRTSVQRIRPKTEFESSVQQQFSENCCFEFVSSRGKTKRRCPSHLFDGIRIDERKTWRSRSC